MQAVDILILSNGPGELATWVRPVVRSLRTHLGNDPAHLRISVVLSPCPHATGKEATIAQNYPEVDRVQAAEHFLPFLLWGKTVEAWDWHTKGVVLFLGGDQFFTVVIGKRLGYRTVVYAEWEARWYRWIDRFALMRPDTAKSKDAKYAPKFTVVGDLMAEVGREVAGQKRQEAGELVGLLPGSKAAKLTQGVPLVLAIAERIQAARPQTRFIIPVAPTLDLPTLAGFADPEQNPCIALVEGTSAELITSGSVPYLKAASGFQVELWTQSPAYDLLAQCSLCLTTVGANTAELGSLGIPMIVLLPSQQLDAMRTWDGIPGLLATLPGVGTVFAKMINWWFFSHPRLVSWPNIWAKAEIVPELLGKLQPQPIADLVVDFLDHPEKLQQMRDRLREMRGEPGAADKLAQLVADEVMGSDGEME